jgi:hypothetical protein
MPRLLTALGLALVLSSAGQAEAQDAVGKQITLLKSEDFRVRTQAALALGASKDKRALVPLCQALDDSNRTVRIATASALGRLRLGGKGCLERRLGVEDQDAVRTSIERALEAVGEGGGAGEAAPAIDSATKYYVALGNVVNAPTSTIAGRVRVNMVRAAKSLGGYAIAPEAETPAQAQIVLKKHPSVKGFYLAPTLAKPVYQGGNLTIQLSIAMLSYPDKVLLGQFPVRLTQEGVSENNPQAELELISMAAEIAMQKFAKHAGSLGS